jgi:hypothetical protein
VTGALKRGAHPIWCTLRLRNGLGASLPKSDDPLDWYAGSGEGSGAVVEGLGKRLDELLRLDHADVGAESGCVLS